MSARRVGVVLVFHGVAPVSGDRRTEIVPPVAAGMLERQARHLLRHYQVLPASVIRDAAARRRRGGRVPVALTFDDDLASHADLTAPLLRRLGVPATFFVCGASLDAPFRFWWEDLQSALDRKLLLDGDLPEVRADLVAAARERRDRGAARLAAAIEELSPQSRDKVARKLMQRVSGPPDDAGLRADAVRGLADAGFDVGFHTLRHDRLPPLDDDALDAAFGDGRAELERAAGRSLTLVSYPHGRADQRVAAAAAAAGFERGFTGEARAVTSNDDPLLLPRIAPTFASVGAFAVQIARFASGTERR